MTKLRHIELDDIGQALRVLREGVGDGFLSEADLESFVLSEKCDSFVADFFGRIIGVMLNDYKYGESVELCFGPMARHTLKSYKALRKATEVGIVKSLAVDPTFKDHGIGTALLQKSVESFKARKINRVLAGAWERNGTCPAEGLLRRVGFKDIATVPDFWTTDSIQRKYECPECGYPCRCSAHIFYFLNQSSNPFRSQKG